jgi:hypothetical protein
VEAYVSVAVAVWIVVDAMVVMAVDDTHSTPAPTPIDPLSYCDNSKRDRERYRLREEYILSPAIHTLDDVPPEHL